MAQEHRSLTRFAFAFVAAALLSGCFTSLRNAPPPENPTSTPQSPGAPPSITPANPRPSAPPPPPRENHLSPATRSLVTQARNLMAHGDFDAASSTLDRALRIEPNNPLLWIELGRLRLAESDAHQAEGCGRKALALASGDQGTQKQAGMLLADALRAQQRNQEAHEVESQPFMR
jgi:tetratricopeptide (TPR) repeat protein